MNYINLRTELKNYYLKASYENALRNYTEGTAKLDKLYDEAMSSYESKLLQYSVVTERIEPVLFADSPFYYEIGILPGCSDGAPYYHGHWQLGAWNGTKKASKYIDFDPETWELTNNQRSELFYLVCGPYNDTAQHFQINHRPIFKHGLKGVYLEAMDALNNTSDEKEKAFLNADIIPLE